MAVQSNPSNGTARAWRETVNIPTYKTGAPNKNPMFFDKRVYQGSSGAVYPFPVIDRVFDERDIKPWNAVFLENRYLKIMLLPELGGRVQMALDKTNQHHFVYYNRVIKPALVGLTGPWISGGIEFNWPQHHRPSTFEPVDATIETRPDGAVTAWCGEIERMFRTKGLAGFTLYPDRAYLEISVKLSNRTPFPQTFLWWANPAVHAGEEYQTVFPPDVHYVMDHGKRAVSDYPIATGTYYKVDYSPGTDISRYKNIPAPTSFMAHRSDFDFLGGYDHGKRAGMLHVANHHAVPGKKQWTWGHGDFGQAWDRHLTDGDGPYVELMCGAFSDNQPDFSWLQPGEEKQFTQYFMPYKSIGLPKNACRDAALSLETAGRELTVGVYASRPMRARILLSDGDLTLLDQEADLSPETPFMETVQTPAGANPARASLRLLEDGREILRHEPLPPEAGERPEPAAPARDPAEIDSNEELYLNGLHLEQYRHATYEPEPYYEEALRRDPGGARCNNAMGLLLLRRGKFAESEPYFRKAIERLTARNPNPYDGEAFYNLGWALKMQERPAEAYAAFYKAAWNAAWRDAACFELARIACREGRLYESLDLLDQSLDRNQNHHQARHLRAAILRRMGRSDGARAEIAAGLSRDPMNYGLFAERDFLERNGPETDIMGDGHARIETALDYAHAGLWDEAAEWICQSPPASPMALYFEAWFLFQKGDEGAARGRIAEAERMAPDYCFPNRFECVPALRLAMELNPGGARAPYYLGNFWRAKRQYADAMACWETAAKLDPRFPTVFRNLGIEAYNRLGDPARADACFEKAFVLDPSDARVLFEWDQLKKRLNEAPADRLARLESHAALTEERDDLAIERIQLLNLLERHQEALELLLGRTFHPWEGGEGKVSGQYVLALTALARRLIREGDPAAALEKLSAARSNPANLGEGKLGGGRDNALDYFEGLAREAMGEPDAAARCFEAASKGEYEPVSALYYNDQPPDAMLYQGLALGKLNRMDEARAVFSRMIEYGGEHLRDNIKMDYFAVSLPDFLVFDDDLNKRNRIHCHYMMALGHMGLGETAAARRHFEAALSEEADHPGARFHLRMMEEGAG